MRVYMKNYLALISACLLFASTQSIASDQSWKRTEKNYYKGFVNSTDSRFQAIVSPKDQETDKPYVGIQLVISSIDFCSDKDQSFEGSMLMTVNDRKVSFITSCYKNKWLNIHPSTISGGEHIIKELNHHRNKMVTFVIPYKDAPDTIFNLPTDNFSPIYNSIDKYVKEAIQ